MDDLLKFDFWGGSEWDFFQGLGKFVRTARYENDHSIKYGFRKKALRYSYLFS